MCEQCYATSDFYILTNVGNITCDFRSELNVETWNDFTFNDDDECECIEPNVCMFRFSTYNENTKFTTTCDCGKCQPKTLQRLCQDVITKLEIEKKHSLKLKQFTISKLIKPISPNQYIYIGTTGLYQTQNYYKVGGSKTKILVYKQQPSVNDNTDQPDENQPDENCYLFLYARECNNFQIIENLINICLNPFKATDNKEMYNILYEDLKSLIDRLIDNERSDVEHINQILPKVYNNLLDVK